MKFLAWDNQQNAEDSIIAVNAVYGCPYEGANGYQMECWDVPVLSKDGMKWGFFKPEVRFGKEMEELMAGVILGFVEHDVKPGEFYPEEESEE